MPALAGSQLAPFFNLSSVHAGAGDAAATCLFAPSQILSFRASLPANGSTTQVSGSSTFACSSPSLPCLSPWHSAGVENG
ncbi:hypothetical protein CEXT_541641 [Caerostris extrusa]|uniref:Secreted protein n=1 Tax=Caerostris extrusa TaxID=172846 RepID=A0AAV4QX61_CAEEX|nr:hypothetical protein CEXT_541641 [Caerostris extrusa]